MHASLPSMQQTTAQMLDGLGLPTTTTRCDFIVAMRRQYLMLSSLMQTTWEYLWTPWLLDSVA